MTADNPAGKDEDFDALKVSHDLIANAATATLATLSAGDGAPFASLVTVAPGTGSGPVLLLSTLARHTRNIAADARASLLFAGTGDGAEDPLMAARITVVGEIVADPAPALREVFLAHHPEAASYAGFSDFAIYRLVPKSAHLVAGFGRIVDVDPGELFD
ncbi:putative heme iron utilization protein [Rhodobium orientis]|uniref:CREG-like beta-barrel domain-containing protein n=1 Tax=Rhodobium orientis TaxID=34017 RepID=A0A327JGM6_9HYPH|nr:pyridoxamine 5'-phosphate oxidase family protein [Rhodobium orientis]MBB4303565.1 putative heme iron utilization protein [Rhodobium orientis]MBK5950494.1 hypothetical protein [Rhodobium orientis]RAI24266.1 hypothetical protein CH339_22605 [Rhodobium orientis]